MKSLNQTCPRTIILLMIMLSFSARAATDADDETAGKEYLETEEFVIIGAGSAAVLGLNYLIAEIDTGRGSLIPSPLPGDRWLTATLGGTWEPGKTNWLDNTAGSALTPAFGAIGLFVTNFSWPEGKPWKDAGQDLFLYHSGLWATKGVTGIFKGVVARPRPFFYFFPNEAIKLVDWEPNDARRSFFSGHTSSAFFAMTYLNKRVRAVMRQRLACNDYQNWRWLPSTVAFSWATYVGWTRIHAYKHYFSDVLAGALAGFALAELFYWFGDQASDNSESNPGTQMLFQLNFTF